MTGFEGFLEAAVRGATPLAFAALGELIAERGGIINLGLEGAIACGALAAAAGALAFGPATGLVAGSVAGLLITLVFAGLVIGLKTEQIITGAAVAMLGLGLSATLHRALVDPGADAIQVATMPALPIPGLSELPVVGPAFFAQPFPTYLLYALFPVVAFGLYRTVGGLALRAVGESPAAAVAAGHRPGRLRLFAVCAGGLLAGTAGATLVVAQTGTYSDGMSAGRGFVAVAIVALGRWHPTGVALGALLFGGAGAVQFLAQAVGLDVPYTLILALPYALTLAALAAARGSASAPAALARAFD